MEDPARRNSELMQAELEKIGHRNDSPPERIPKAEVNKASFHPMFNLIKDDIERDKELMLIECKEEFGKNGRFSDSVSKEDVYKYGFEDSMNMVLRLLVKSGKIFIKD